MTYSITTKLIQDGNSTAVRLPKVMLKMSGLQGKVRLEAKKDQIIVHAINNPRENWTAQIDAVVASGKAAGRDRELDDWDAASGDGIDD